MELQPITYKEACVFIDQHHRHHLHPQGWKFGIALNDSKKIIGVITIGRPIARHKDGGWTLEVTRCCTDGTKNANSKLYASAWRAVKAMGFKRLITYILASETGISLKAAGWKTIGECKGGTWNRKSRKRIDKYPTGQKTLWEAI